MRSNRLAGHTLPSEGRIFDAYSRLAVGPARCSCGAESPELTSDSARRKWHASHKDKIRHDKTAEPAKETL